MDFPGHRRVLTLTVTVRRTGSRKFSRPPGTRPARFPERGYASGAAPSSSPSRRAELVENPLPVALTGGAAAELVIEQRLGADLQGSAHHLPLYGEAEGVGTIAYGTGLANVRDAIPFPRTPGNARY
jgi:hypothetical protein